MKKSSYLKLTGEAFSGEIGQNKTPRQLKNGFWTPTKPTQRPEYTPIAISTNLMKELGLDPISELENGFFNDVIRGENVDGFSMAYAGYQFGEFAGQLGDGRVINLFKVNDYELQLKGTGLTPFSRFADGKAVLRSSIREFIISESLHGIGIYSSRALSLVGLPKTLAQRNGAEMCAIVCRLAPSWVRIGHFDLCRLRGDRSAVNELCDYLIEEVFQNKWSDEVQRVESSEVIELSKYDKLFLEVIVRNARAVAQWQSYGFLNGVLNTDNTSILGMAMDFGPFSFMDEFDPKFTPNSEDHMGRYSFEMMPSAIWFNMIKMGEAMGEVLGAGPKFLKNEEYLNGEGVKEEWIEEFTKRAMGIVEAGGELFEKVYIDSYLTSVCSRLGIKPRSSDHSEVLGVLFEMLKATKVNYNKFFVKLQGLELRSPNFDYDEAAKSLLGEGGSSEEKLGEVKSFLASFKARVEDEELSDELRLERAKGYNPLFLPHNWMFDEVIERTTEQLRDIKNGEEVPELGDMVKKMLAMASNPYDVSKWGEEMKDVEKRWLEEKGTPMIQCSCSS